MIELQLLNKILQDNSPMLLIKNGIDENYFVTFRDEYNFIMAHYNKYKKMPDKETILEQNNLKLEFFSVSESEKYLIDAAREQKLFDDSVKVLKTVSDILSTDSIKAVEYLRARLPELSAGIAVDGTDITKSKERLETIRKKQRGESQVIKTGLPELDEVLYGWLPGEELVTIVARTGQGKTWLLLKFLVSAWEQGKRVGVYSGEMSGERIGYRVDTLIEKISNKDLVRGDVKNVEQYDKYLQELAESEIPFYVITKKELGGRATVSKLRSFAIANQLDILGIDQYTLMQDERAGRNSNTREQLEHISSDLFDLSSELGIPILVLSQANRGGARSDETGGTPEVENIYGADAIAQNATKVLTIRQTGAGLEIAIKKNRDDKIGDKLLYFWDIDNGILKYVPNEEDKFRDPSRIEEARSKFKDGADVF